MGVIPDSTVLIAAERAGYTPREISGDLTVKLGDTEAVFVRAESKAVCKSEVFEWL
jgi:hypothetical protein